MLLCRFTWCCQKSLCKGTVTVYSRLWFSLVILDGNMLKKTFFSITFYYFSLFLSKKYFSPLLPLSFSVLLIYCHSFTFSEYSWWNDTRRNWTTNLELNGPRGENDGSCPSFHKMKVHTDYIHPERRTEEQNKLHATMCER